MGKTIEIQIPVIVGSNGKWCANGYDSMANPAADADWGFMYDSLDSSSPDERDPVWPAADRRYIIRATIEVPEVAVVNATAVEVETVD